MNTTTVAGPFSKEEAEETAKALGLKNHSVYGRAKNKVDELGVEYTDFDDCDYYVERHLDIVAETIFGMSWDEIKKRQGGGK